MIRLRLLLVGLLLAQTQSLAALALSRQGFGAPAAQGIPVGWNAQGGKWQQVGSVLYGEGQERSACVLTGMGSLASGELSVMVTADQRLGSGWAYTALALYQDSSNFWQLALVASPGGDLYAELLENERGRWQAQSGLGTELTSYVNESSGDKWHYGERYRLTLTLTEQTIEATVADAASGTLLRRIGYRFAFGVHAVCSGKAALLVASMRAHFEGFTSDGEEMDLASRIRQKGRTARAAVISSPENPRGGQLAAQVQSLLSGAGFQVANVSWDEAAAPDWGRGNPHWLLVLIDAGRFPYPALANVEDYLEQGGHLLVVGPPPFQQLLVRGQAGWATPEEALSATRPDTVILDFARENLSAWERGTATPEVKTQAEIMPEGPTASALHVALPRVDQWDTFSRAGLYGSVPAGQTLTCLWAKGDENTPQIVVEWREQDGSRWIAVVNLQPQWQHYALAPEQFKYWPDSRSQGRGGEGDYLHLENAELFSVGIARSHCEVPEAAHNYWLAEVGTATAPFSTAALQPPLLEALSPAYKTYSLGAVAQIQQDGGATTPVGSEVSGWFTVERNRGLGMAPGRPGRLKVYARGRNEAGGEGPLVWRYVSLVPPDEGSSWAGVLLEDDRGRAALPAEVLPALQQMLQDIRGRTFIARAGAYEFSYTVGEKVPLGVEALNLGVAPAAASAQVRVVGEGDSVAAFVGQASAELDAGGKFAKDFEWDPATAGFYVVEVQVSEAGQVVDSVRQPMTVLPSAGADGDFVRVNAGDFSLGDQPWRPLGLNYWPRYIAGQERSDYWAHWLDPAEYDPEVVSRDLDLLQSLGATMISVQAGTPECLRSLNDFLARAHKRGLRANLFLPGAHPLSFDSALVRRYLEEGRLASNPAIFAYDIAWEPRWGKHAERKAWDGQWQAWIEDRYGSVASAEADWGVECPRENGAITNPGDEQIPNDGPWRRMVAAYRRFLDDFLSERLNEVCSFIRSLDSNHLISFRAGYGGTGQEGVDVVMPFDLASGAKHLDFISPEGWGLWGGWDKFQPAGVTTLYGRWAGNGRPVFWAEFGYNVHPGYKADDFARQQETYDNMYRFIAESGASGGAGWWFPGGLRLDENSDYGVVNPDGTPRSAALALKDWAGRPAQTPWARQGQVPIQFDRDLHPRGYSQVWVRARNAYLEVVAAGQVPFLRTGGDGTDSLDTPLLAVGGTKCNGSNPPKYLNAEFNQVLARTQGLAWQPVAEGAAVTLGKAGRLDLWARMGNTGEAAWVSPDRAGARPGGVFLVVEQNGQIVGRAALTQDAPRYADADVLVSIPSGQMLEGELRLYLEAAGRTSFGHRFRLAVAQPAP